jgi:hypothetical protein
VTDNTRIWLHGLGAAAIGSSASSIATILVAPDRFNLTSLSGTGHVFMVAVVAGVVNAAAYLAKSPLPPLVMGPGDVATLKNPSITPDGTISGSSATLTKAPDPKP